MHVLRASPDFIALIGGEKASGTIVSSTHDDVWPHSLLHAAHPSLNVHHASLIPCLDWREPMDDVCIVWTDTRQ